MIDLFGDGFLDEDVLTEAEALLDVNKVQRCRGGDTDRIDPGEQRFRRRSNLGAVASRHLLGAIRAGIKNRDNLNLGLTAEHADMPLTHQSDPPDAARRC